MPALNAYGEALQRAQSTYGDVLSAYGAGQNALQSQLGGIYAGYSGLTNNVQGLMKQGYDLGLGDIQKQAAVNYGNVTQGLAQRGLSNSTIWGNLQNQASAQTQREIGGLAYNVGNQAAERQQQVGLAQLAAQMQGVGMQSNLYGQQGATLAHFPWPQYPYGASGYGGGGGGGGYGGSGRVSGGGYGQTNWGTDPNNNIGRNAYSSVSPYQANSYGGQGLNIPSYGQSFDNSESAPNDPYDPYGNNFAGSAGLGLDPYGNEWEDV